MAEKRKVTLVEINVYEEMLPLVSGYLQAYACSDPALREAYEFEKFTTNKTKPAAALLHELVAKDSDIYAFSCYLWNMGRVKSILPGLLRMRPKAQVLLGGPQVMHHAADYLDPDNERLIICNGEGEKTFANYLRELLLDSPDFSRVRGLSFYREGTLTTTGAEERILTLDEIPSPFLTGVFDEGSYRMSIMETNRGCPFHCGFCFWGAATNDRVAKYSEERVREELTWLAKHEVPFIFLADANWGMLKRDVALSEHIVECNKKYKAPIFIYFSAAKNSPQRVTQITELFTKAGLFNTQPISMQSLSTTTLETVQRKNIKLSAFETLQDDLNAREIASFIELIWPLPGETLASFKEGIGILCGRGASCVTTYPHLLLHNTPIYKQREEFGLLTKAVADDAAEAEVVVGTADVTNEEFHEGMRFIYAFLALYHTRSLQHLCRYLHDEQIMGYDDLFSAFNRFCMAHAEHPFSKFCEQSLENTAYYDLTNYPKVYHDTLHADRGAFAALLKGFASSLPWWSDRRARLLFEVDMISRPYLYSNTPLDKPDVDLEFLKIKEVQERQYLVEVSADDLEVLRPLVLQDQDSTASGGLLRVNHERSQYPYRPRKNEFHDADYCNGMIMRIVSILPLWEFHQRPLTQVAQR